MDDSSRSPLSKVPHVTLGFWLIKILATTVGETGGDALSMTFSLGYAVSSLIFLAFFIAALAAQVRSRRYHPLAYWTVVVATTTVGTTVSDYLDRTVGLGYVRSSILLFGAVLAIIALWQYSAGRVEFENITTRKEEVFYWWTILAANTLGTALGDFTATTLGLGFERGALLFFALLAAVAALRYLPRRPSASGLFWSAYVLTRPLGATLGDTLTKPHADGGLALGRVTSSLVIAAFMAAGIALTALARPEPVPARDDA